MTLERFYQWSTVLPLALPVATAPLTLLSENDVVILGAIGRFARVLLAAAVAGGVSYLLLGLPVLWLLRHQSARVYQLVSLVAPLAFTAALCIYLLIVSAVRGPDAPDLGSGVASGRFVAPWVLGIGYFYVAVAHALAFLLKRIGVVRSKSAA
jgi:hypothetical protein